MKAIKTLKESAEILTSPLLTTKEAADPLRWTEGRRRNPRAQGGGPAFVKVGSSVLYRLEDLEAFVEIGRPTGRAGRELAGAARSSE